MQGNEKEKNQKTNTSSSRIMPDPIVKGEFLQYLDQKSWDRISNHAESVKKSLEKLKSDPEASFVDLAVEFGYFSNSDGEEHLRKDWLDHEKGWFKKQPAPSIQPILRAGVIKAIELSIEHRLPIDSYWVRGGDQIEVVLTKSAQQITVLIMTPTILESEIMGRLPLPGKFRPVDPIHVIRDPKPDKRFP